MPENSEEITITLTRFREPDSLLDMTLSSLEKQVGVKGEVLLLDQAWRESYARTVESRSTDALRFRCLNCEPRSLSFARNEGMKEAANAKVFFTDPDVITTPTWASELARVFDGRTVGMAGSRVLPKWRGTRPILSYSRIVCDQYSIFDLGLETLDTHRVVGAAMAIDRNVAGYDLEFDEGLGRRGGILVSGEDSDMCQRVVSAGKRVVYVGSSLVYHQILTERLNSAWVWKRLYHAGAGRARLGGAPNPSAKLGLMDYLMMPAILPPYALGYLRERRRQGQEAANGA